MNTTSAQKKIKNVTVVRAGSPPDVDTDFHTVGRNKVIQYVIDKHGAENVANIITQDRFKARASFKAMCTIYGIPFAQANKIAALIPLPADGKDCSIDDLINPTSRRYAEGADFREATSSPEWQEILTMAAPFDSRIKGTGVHACGLIISSEPLNEHIPTQIRQDDGAHITQWTHPECESIGLFKMDFLGLDTIDIRDSACENIRLAGKEVPDMKKLKDGPMDDPKTYEMLCCGDTVGIFQLGGGGVRDLLRRVKPTEFTDIAAITALYRPGPMKSGAHIEYADRKNGINECIPMQKEFYGTPVEDILKETYGLCIYQEQVMKIATDFCHMTPYESELLRKAMGKKKKDIMMSLKPKFTVGITDQGFSEDLAEKLWASIDAFSEYGFNKSHSVSYAINAYQCAYLKANYPAEFMAALIQQNTGEKKKIVAFLQEAATMGLSVGPVNINTSQVSMSSPIDEAKYDIVYGFTGVNQVNDELAHTIIKEREKNGKFKSVQDFVKRISQYMKINTQALSNLALSGAFDDFGVSRKLVEENASVLIGASSREASMGMSLFDLVDAENSELTSNIELHGEDYSYGDKVRKEAECVGMYVSGHPTANIGPVAKSYSPTTIAKLKNTKPAPRVKHTLIGTFTQIVSKTNRAGNKTIQVTFDDGTDRFETYLLKDVVARVEKGVEFARIANARRKAEANGYTYEVTHNASKRGDMLRALIADDKVIPIKPLLENAAYIIQVSIGRRVNIVDIEALELAPNGSIPFVVAVDDQTQLETLVKLFKATADGGIYVKCVLPDSEIILKKPIKLTAPLIRQIESIVGLENVLTHGI